MEWEREPWNRERGQAWGWCQGWRTTCIPLSRNSANHPQPPTNTTYMHPGGDGPKLPLLAATIEEWGLGDRVQLLGAVRHDDVRALLIRGDIFINCSLTEAFCMALVEAAAAGT